MKNNVLIAGLTNLPRGTVRRTILLSDSLVIIGALLLSRLLVSRIDVDAPPVLADLAFCSLWVLSGIVIVAAFRLHLIKLVVFGGRDLLRVAAATSVITLAGFALGMMWDAPRYPTLSVVFGLFFFAGAVGTRAIAIAILSYLRDMIWSRDRVAIFGAGGSGVQMATALRQSERMRPVVFFDDNPALHNMEVGGLPVLDPRTMAVELQRREVSKMLIALPPQAQSRTSDIVRFCDSIGVDVQVLPTFVEMIAENRKDPFLNTVDPHEVLGRERVVLDTPEIAKSYAGRVVMVTGAGGSIGSELCRQLLNCNPAKIVLFDHSEFNLYQIDQEFSKRATGMHIPYVACLGSVTSPATVKRVMEEQKVEIVLHAAAYKHVPIVEGNEIEGARNNVLGTKIVADAAVAAGVERFILVSTDKAVRPANIMGATKRMAELVVQDVQTRAPSTTFAMVRFGNVLGSSGSVIPLFQTQIDSGGPLTVTHPEVTRFFMTVSEASRLVLLAGAFAEGGDVFVLDMGKPQRIMDIAQKMVRLSGRTVKDPKTGKGDIEIIVTGLRPGEKLYEELLIDNDNLIKTPHPKILRAEEGKLSQIEVAGFLREIQTAIDTANPEQVRKTICDRVEGYRPQTLPLEA